MHFRDWQVLNFKQNFIKTCSLGSNWQYGSIDSDNGLASNMWEAVILSNVGMFYWHNYASLVLNELHGTLNDQGFIVWIVFISFCVSSLAQVCSILSISFTVISLAFGHTGTLQQPTIIIIHSDDCVMTLVFQWPLLLTWFNFNPSMDK